MEIDLSCYEKNLEFLISKGEELELKNNKVDTASQ